MMVQTLVLTSTSMHFVWSSVVNGIHIVHEFDHLQYTNMEGKDSEIW